MPIVNIPRDEWAEFLDAFSRQHRSWLAIVEQPVGEARRSAGDPRPLESVRSTGDRSHLAIEIAFAGDSRGDAVRVRNPTSLGVSKTDDGADRGLEIMDDEGVCTRVRFRAAAIPEMVDGLAPGEL